MSIDATDHFESMVRLLETLCLTLDEWNKSDQTGADIKNFWNEMQRIHPKAEQILCDHDDYMERVDAMLEEEGEDELVVMQVAIVDEGKVH